MLDVTLADDRYICGQPADLVVRLVNTGAGLCTHIFVRLALPGALLVLSGGTIELGRLPAGQSATHTLRIHPRQAGRWAITSPNCSYRDEMGRVCRIDNLRLEVLVAPAPAAPAARAPAGPGPAEARHLRQQIADHERLIYAHGRRLQKRKEQQAHYGAMTEPSILIEIEEIEATIIRLQRDIVRLRQRLGQ